MLNYTPYQLLEIIADRFSPEELIEIMDIKTWDLIDKFTDEILDFDWSEHL